MKNSEAGDKELAGKADSNSVVNRRGDKEKMWEQPERFAKGKVNQQEFAGF